jgi:hypothetical protein
MSARFVFFLHCDVPGCQALFESFSDVPASAWERVQHRAKRHGWTLRDDRGSALCPKHTTGEYTPPLFTADEADARVVALRPREVRAIGHAS